jgi:hypothetical protein
VQKETKICLGCRHFRLEDIHSGICRVEKKGNPYPMKLHTDSCESWAGCGQQYFIRLGWIKSKKAELEGKKGS